MRLRTCILISLALLPLALCAQQFANSDYAVVVDRSGLDYPNNIAPAMHGAFQYASGLRFATNAIDAPRAERL